MQRLASDYEVIYLTHRPHYFGPKSKQWLASHGYPAAPLLLSDVRGFLGGSRKFKSARLKELREHFTNLEVGVGDKIGDALAYHENGLMSILVLPLPDPIVAEELIELAASLEALPPEVHVVRNWRQVERAIYEGVSYPPSNARDWLEDWATDLTAGATQPTTMPAFPEGER
jgi:hypothetical protein